MDLNVSVKAESLWSVDLGPLGTFNFTNSFLMMLIVMALIVLFGWLIARRHAIVPNRWQGGFEVVTEFMLNIVEGAAGKRLGRKVFPMIGALFFFIIIANYAGLLPGVGTIGEWEREPSEPAAAMVASAGQSVPDTAVPAQEESGKKILKPFLRSPNADLNMTLGMAFVAFFYYQVLGIQAQGVRNRIKHMSDPPFLFPIEVVSELSRLISLSFRLFGNIFAGEVLVTVMYAMSKAIAEKTAYIGIITAFIPTVFLFLELLFGFIQALVFALLSLAYITLARGHEDEEHHEEGHAVPAAAAAGD